MFLRKHVISQKGIIYILFAYKCTNVNLLELLNIHHLYTNKLKWFFNNFPHFSIGY